jgi:hypothetical protein
MHMVQSYGQIFTPHSLYCGPGTLFPPFPAGRSSTGFRVCVLHLGRSTTLFDRVLRGDSSIALEESLGLGKVCAVPLTAVDADRLSDPETLFPDGGGQFEVIETLSHLPSEFSSDFASAGQIVL